MKSCFLHNTKKDGIWDCPRCQLMYVKIATILLSLACFFKAS